MKGVLKIHGVIGSYTDESGQQVKGVELLDVIAQVKAQPKATSFLAEIGSPGGLVDAGNQIYDYLISLKQNGIPVNTITSSYLDDEGNLKYGVGSIATKIFLAGDERMIVDGHEFFIHNPWTQIVGDGKKIKMELKGLEQTEAELRSFYQAHTKISEAGLKGLMDNQTGMDADNAVQLGFATKKVAPVKVKAFALLNNNNMSKPENAEEKSLLQKIRALVSFAEEQPSAAPAAQPNAIQAAMLEDGEYKLADGRVLVISGGMIQEVKPAEAMPEEAPEAQAAQPAQPAAQDTSLLDKIAALEAKLSEMATAHASEVEAKVNAAVAEKLDGITAGQAPRRAFNNNGQGSQGQPQIRNISSVMAAKREERKKQINSNKY